MLSIISWVSNDIQYQGLLDSCRQNGIKAEFIKVGQEAKSMAEAYTIGTEKAKGDIFVYAHQDVRIHDPEFANKLEILFLAHPEVGFAGPIGSIQMSGRSWWEVGPGCCRGRVIQGEDNNWLSFNGGNNYNGPCRQLDGLMLVTNKRWLFPLNLPGIHFFDLWMCRIAELEGRTNWIFDSAIQHISGGENTSQSFNDNYELYKKIFLV